MNKEQAEKRLQAAMVRLLITNPFFASLVMKREMEVVDDGSCPTACVDRHGKIKFNADLIGQLTLEELMYVLAHETMHVVYGHLPRLNGRDPKLWNIATDAVINDLLDLGKAGRRPNGAIHMPGASEYTADEVYEKLMQGQPKQKNSGGKQKDGNLPQGPSSPAIEDLPEEEAKACKPMDSKAAEAQGKIEMAEAMQMARAMGKLPGELGKRIEEVLKSKVPWHEVLERFMSARSERHQTWNRPNKRYAGRFYLPHRDRLPSMGEVVIALDSSGSISEREISSFLGHVNRILEDCHPTKVHLLFVTTEVEREVCFEDGEPIKLEGKCRYYGGTDMGAGVRWTEKNAPDASVFICFTDGWTPWPKRTSVETFWMVTNKHRTAPVGTTIFVEP